MEKHVHESNQVSDQEPEHPFILNNMSKMKIRKFPVGTSFVLQIDDLYADPDAVRELALTLEYKQTAGMHPGRFASLAKPPSELLKLLNPLMEKYAGRRVELNSSFSNHRAFASIPGSDEGWNPLQKQPHTDQFCDFAGVVYLNPNHQCSGGTSFWRHRQSGLTRAPRADDADVAPLLQRFGVDTGSQLISRFLAMAITESRQKPKQIRMHWDRVRTLKMQFNRFIVYDARLFHSPHLPPPGFGTRIESSRLTQNVYLNHVP